MKTFTKIVLIACLWMFVINSGTLGMDTGLRLQMAHAWWTGKEEVQVSPDDKPKVPGDIRFGVIGVGGKRYIAYEPGQSLLMLPGDWVGTQLHRLFPVLDSQDWRELTVNLLIFIPLNVAAIVSCFWLVQLFGFEARIASLTSLSLLLGTTFLYYAMDNQHNNQVLLFVTLGYATALAYVQRGIPRFAFLSGLVLGAAILIRITSAIHALTGLLFLLGCIAYQSRNYKKVLQTMGLWVSGLIPFTLLGRIIDYCRYGSFLATGKSVEKLQLTTDPMWSGLPAFPSGYPLINDPHIGIFGALFSPFKSIFIYDPLLFPCLILGIIFWSRFSPYIQWYLITAILNLGLHLAAYSRFVFWHGDSAWAARYHVTSVHLLLIPLIAYSMQYLLSSKKTIAWLMKGIIAFAIVVQICSVIFSPNLEIFQVKLGMPGSRLNFRLAQRLTNVVCLVNSSFSNRCIEQTPEKKRYLQKWNKPIFIPFTFQENSKDKPELLQISQTLFFIWVLLIVTAIISTILFVVSI